jgi:hypothetical protein
MPSLCRLFTGIIIILLAGEAEGERQSRNIVLDGRIILRLI